MQSFCMYNVLPGFSGAGYIYTSPVLYSYLEAIYRWNNRHWQNIHISTYGKLTDAVERNLNGHSNERRYWQTIEGQRDLTSVMDNPISQAITKSSLAKHLEIFDNPRNNVKVALDSFWEIFLCSLSRKLVFSPHFLKIPLQDEAIH